MPRVLEDATAVRPVLRRVSQDIELIRSEIDAYYKEIEDFQNLSPDEVMVKLSGIAARLVHIRGDLVRSDDRAKQKVRTMEIEPLLESCDYQFKIFSRIQSIRQMDWDVSKGGV